MKTLLALLVVLSSSPAMAQMNCTASTYGNQTYTNCIPTMITPVQPIAPIQPIQPVAPVQRPLNCTTSRYGNQTYTNCY